MMQFKGFKPEAMKKIQGALGFQGYAEDFDKYLEDNPYNKKAVQMMQGGYVKGYANGGAVEYTGPRRPDYGSQMSGPAPGIRTAEEYGSFDGDGFFGDPRRIRQDLNFDPATGTYTPVEAMQRGSQQDPRAINTSTNTPTSTGTNAETIGQAITNRAYDPRLPQGAEVQPVGTVATADQFVDPSSGQVSGDFTIPIDTAATGTAQMPVSTAATTMDATTTAADVAAETAGNLAAQGIVSTDARVIAQQQADSSVSGLNAAQGTGILMSNPVQRKVETGELISGAANAEVASNYAEQIEAAQATPTKQATVQGQLEGLMQQFEGGNTPPWAAGAMRNATAQMAARGLGASSMAGQALV